MWAVKGRFETALEDNDDAVWTFVDGQDILQVLVVRKFFFLLFILIFRNCDRLMVSYTQLWL